jgi:hypothetical protein
LPLQRPIVLHHQVQFILSTFNNYQTLISYYLGSFYVSRLAYPRDYRTLEYISTLSQNLTGNTQLWLGLDARLDNN